MDVVDSITADSKQKQTLSLTNGASIIIQMEYKPLQSSWYFTSIAYGDFEITNIRICSSPNMLHQFKNKIPFGIAIKSIGNFEPTQQQDFLSKRSVMYILNSDETEAYYRYLQGGT
jgi:hypothetical protein